MSDAEESDVDPVLGEPVEAAVEVVRDREPEADPESVRSTLDLVAEDDTVSRAAVSSAVGDVAQHVATPENRLESTDEALDAARAAAEPARDLDPVRARLDGFESRYRDLEEDVDALRSRLDDLVERGRHPEDVYDLARSCEDLKWETRDAHQRAEELRADLESFEAWANDPTVRFDELDGDVDHVAGLLDDLADAVEALDASERGGAEADDLAVAWGDAVLQHRVLGLLLSDLRAELSALRTWAERDGAEAAGSDGATARDIQTRIDDLGSRERHLGERLDRLARPAWRARVGERIEAFETDLASVEPPVQWGAVQGVLEEHRSALAP